MYSLEGSPRESNTVFCNGSLQDILRSRQAGYVNITKGTALNCGDTIIWGIFPRITQAFHLAYFFQCFLFIYILKKASLYIKIFPLETKCLREFPGSPVVRTLHFYYHGPGVQSLVGDLRSRKPCGVAPSKKKKNQTKKTPKLSLQLVNPENI